MISAAPIRGRLFSAALGLFCQLDFPEGKAPGQIPAALAHGVILLRRPVMDAEQVKYEIQLWVRTLR